MTDRMITTRRGVMGLMAAGAAGFAGACSPRGDNALPDGAISADGIACAEPLFSVSYSDEQRAQLVRSMEGWVTRAEALRAHHKPNALHPAQIFDPRLPGVQYRAQDDVIRNLPGNAGPVPTDSVDIAFAPVWKQAAWMAAGQLSSAALTEIYLERIARHGAALECFITVTADRARAQARARDAERAAGRVRGPLHGIPYGLKDIIDVAGMPATWGATPYRERVGEETAVVALRLEEAGAVLLGKTSVGALAYGDIWFDGVCRNPFNPREGSSGSSAGSASATAAGLCAFSIGTETLGSIVSPSHRCGTAGLRPTFGRVARTGAMALCWTLDKVGPITRHVADTAYVLAAINGGDAGDPASFDHGFACDFARDLSGLRLGYNPQWLEEASDLDREAFEAARSLGVRVEPFNVDDKPYAALLIQLEAEAAAAFEELTLSGRDSELRWQDDVAWPNTFRRARFISGVDLVNVDRLRRQVMAMMAERMDGLDAVMGPNFAGNMLLITNYTGHPQLALRAGFESQRTRTIFGAPADDSEETFQVPYATSLWAPLFEEGTLVSLGHAIEQRLGVAGTRPSDFS
ncbi:amidase [Glycocaulis sp.]|uniref:amidase n=1 Tax=Glycocaulis sp. TaxID=1969725 RepID=UPI0025C5D42C|nr:amidase [Glycocaulis sp.]MCH8522605.1 amidase [Glycocaulis sp.]